MHGSTQTPAAENDHRSAAAPARSTAKRVRPPAARLRPQAARAYEDELRGRLGLAPLGRDFLSRAQARTGWIITGVVALLAALIRFIRLGYPPRLIFDETYYVKGANSLLRLGYEADWEGGNENDPLFAAGDYSMQKTGGDYVVHPPLGKWIMASGQAIFGQQNGFGWRFATALIGAATVILLVRVALRLFNSPALAGFAGAAIALDGMGIVMSRTGLLDNILAFFILAGFWAILRDRDAARAKLAHRVATGQIRANATPADPWGPAVHTRPWILAAGVLLGMACGVKWSGFYPVAVFGVVVFIWGTLARRAVHTRLWFGAGIFREGLPAFLWLVPASLLTYLAAWIPWFANPNGFMRSWTPEQVAADMTNYSAPQFSFLPDAFNTWLAYHAKMMEFHTHLSSEHTYMSQPWEWLVQWRPVSFYWVGSDDEKMKEACGAGRECVEAITSVGNVAVWWPALLALGVVLFAAIVRRDWRAGAILAGYLATWAPWLLYSNRTIFQFYAVALLPFVCLALAFAAGYVTGSLGRPRARRLPLPVVVGSSLKIDDGVWQPVKRPESPVSGQDVMVMPVAYPYRARHHQAAGLVGEHAAGEHATGEHATGEVAVEQHPAGAHAIEQHPADQHLAGQDSINAMPWWHAELTSSGRTLLIGGSIVIAIFAAFWYPIWTGMTVPRWFWQAHMWLPSWI